MSHTLIELKNITKFYKIKNEKKMILDKINFSFIKGEWTMILGKSGSGKSSLLNLLTGLDTANEGSLTFAKEYQKKSWDYLRRHNIGIVFQSFNLLNDFTVLENIMLPAYFTKRSKKDIYQTALNYLKKFDLENNLNQKPNTLSGGEQQRVAIARALINNPDIIFADEPTGNLDKKNSNTIMQIFAELKKQGKTIIMVTHEENLLQYSDNYLYIKKGKIVELETRP